MAMMPLEVECYTTPKPTPVWHLVKPWCVIFDQPVTRDTPLPICTNHMLVLLTVAVFIHQDYLIGTSSHP